MKQVNWNIWTMRDGKEVSVREMTTLHIRNCVNMLRKNLVMREQYQPMIEELQSIIELLEKHKPKTGVNPRTEKILEMADTDLMMADTILEQQQEFTRNWIKVFEEELKDRETN